jgi:hypothetical protein
VTKLFEFFFFNSFGATLEISRIEIGAHFLGDKAGEINISYVRTGCGLSTLENMLCYGNYPTEEGIFGRYVHNDRRIFWCVEDACVRQSVTLNQRLKV